MSLFSYQIFHAIVKHQSFIQAAEAMHLTPSAVSQAVSKLEKKFGVSLFIRDRHGARLTNEGKLISVHIQTILDTEEQIAQEISRINGLESGKVIIGTFNSVTVQWIPALVNSFRRVYPRIDVTVYQGEYHEVLDWILTNTVDIALISAAMSEGVSLRPLYCDRIVCLAPSGMYDRKKTFLTVEDIKDRNIIYQRAGFDVEISEYLKKHHLMGYSPFRINDDQSIAAMVESGLGVSMLPELVIKGLKLNNIDIFPINPAIYRTIGVATAKRNIMAPAVKSMYEHILSLYADQRIVTDM